MMTFLTSWPTQTWALLVEAAPWLLAGFVFAGAVYVLLPVGQVTRHLGTPGVGGVVKAALLGIPLPLCSCSVIPVASSIRKQGASRGAFVSFLISTPETGVDSIAISYALLGPFLAIVRPVAAFITAVTAGILVTRSADAESRGADQPGEEACAEQTCGCSSGCTDDAAGARGGRIAAALRYGLVDLFVDLSPWLVSGFLLAGLISALLPAGFLEQHVGTGLPAMLLMLVVGLPLYVCATSSTPVAAALIAGGLSPGAALVFLLVGPATNITTILVVARDVGRRGLAIYLLTIGGVAVLVGLAIDMAQPVLQFLPVGVGGGAEHGEGVGALAAGVALCLLMLNGLRLRAGLSFAAKDVVQGAPS